MKQLRDLLVEHGKLGCLVGQHVLLHLAHHQQPVQHLLHVEPVGNGHQFEERYRKKTPFIDFNKPVQQLGGIPDWTVRDTASLWLKVEHVVSVLRRLWTLAQVELVELDGTAERVLVILVLLVHLSVLGLLAFRRGWVISEQDGALLLPRLVGEVSLLPVLHDVGEGELQVHVHSLQLEVLRVEVHQSVQKHLIEQNSISR